MYWMVIGVDGWLKRVGFMGILVIIVGDMLG